MTEQTITAPELTEQEKLVNYLESLTRSQRRRMMKNYPSYTKRITNFYLNTKKQ